MNCVAKMLNGLSQKEKAFVKDTKDDIIMNRKFKFRAWWTDTMAPIYDFMDEYLINVLDGEDDNPFIYSQWTGLTDINGCDIYEDDIVSRDGGYSGDHYEDYCHCLVVWEDGCFILINNNFNFPFVAELNSTEINNRRIKSIGNIHENPELKKDVNYGKEIYEPDGNC